MAGNANSGRKSLLTPELLDKAIEYMNGGWQLCGDQFPSEVGMAVELGVTPQTLENWNKDESGIFFGMLEELKPRGARVLLNKGLSGEHNSTICKLVLSKHGYHERTEHLVDDLSMSPSERKQRIAAILQKGRERADGDSD